MKKIIIFRTVFLIEFTFFALSIWISKEEKSLKFERKNKREIMKILITAPPPQKCYLGKGFNK